MQPKISIVTAYYNRYYQFTKTLESISKSLYKNYEVIAVDDCSTESERLESLKKQYPFLKVYRLEYKNKWYVNPCIPFNIGITKATGNIVILQNPECLHIHDILSYVANNISDDNYLTMSAYALNIENSRKLYNSSGVRSFFQSLPQKRYGGEKKGGWLNHSVYRPSYFHFCSAITKENLDILKGFDEKYAMGIGYDDNDFVMRIRKLGLKVEIVDNISVVHQWHSVVYSDLNLAAKNKKIYEEAKIANK